ncbi:hypothetical protein [Mesonia aquimarina]|uniref:hypothetical protein n=1 Tax=Mesonia aquimarina TaxID=1504967 RepID=UPI000EF56F00|nr:hypothetical protein [Mesonia aquimarina]
MFFVFVSCSNDDNAEATLNEPKLIVKFEFDENQIRLDNLGQPTGIVEGNAAQTPVFNKMSAHYIELSPNAATLLGDGEVIYKGEETTKGGERAIDFSQAKLISDGETFLEIPLSRVQPGRYTWVRISASYQNASINILNNGNEFEGTIAAFLGYNTYIKSFDIKGNTIELNQNKLQGYWAFEAQDFVVEGQAPEGAVTVPNPLFETSPIPQGSCVLTGRFDDEFVISGSEKEDLVVTLSFSVNNSFEWQEVNQDGKYEPSAGETLVDMGLRGVVPKQD